MPLKPEPVPEFSRPISRERLGGQILVEEISATPQERAALARRFGLLGLDLLHATAKFEPADGADPKGVPGGVPGLLRLSGHISAEVSQACVVTLEPVASRVEADFSLLFNLDGGPLPASAMAREVVFDPEAEEPAEALGPSGLDLGEAVAQQLALALNSYPRAPGAALAEAGTPESGTDAPTGPFGVLEALRKNA